MPSFLTRSHVYFAKSSAQQSASATPSSVPSSPGSLR
jgi:hypothetical protein